jgi:hypothetical protein
MVSSVLVLNCCSAQGYIEVFTTVLTVYPIYHTCIHPFLPWFSFKPSPLTSGIVSIVLFFTFTYMCTQYFYHIHFLTRFSHHLPFLLVPTPHPQQDLHCLPVFQFSRRKKKKNMIFLLV